jgi:putative Mg2+ transporter-C (MgtC) family protein
MLSWNDMDESVLHLLQNPFNGPLLLSAVLGVLIGIEREIAGKDPSIRTFSLISMGSCLFAMLSWESLSEFGIGDPSRIAAQIIPGIGFIGAGTIFRSKQGVSGFTTAALMWVTAGIGMAVGLKRSDLAISATLFALFLTLSLRLVHKVVRRARPERVREVSPPLREDQ